MSVPQTFGRYIEPFVGSACLFFAIEPADAILGDFNVALMETYRTIAVSPDEVLGAALEIPDNERAYYRLREVHPETLEPIPRAARFVYLNRHCFNGVYRTNLKGQFNVPRGRDTGTLPSMQDFKNCAILLQRASLRAGDFEYVLEETRPGDFVYLDPPYAKADERYSGEYGYGAFSSEDFGRLLCQLERINNLGAIFLLSYRYGLAVHRQLRKWNTSVVSVRRHVAGFSGARGDVRELLVSNRQIVKAH